MNGVDPIKLYFGDDYKLTDAITIRQPTLGDVIDIGEEQYFSVVQMLTAIPSDMKAPLWDVGIDWTEFSDLEMFSVMTSQLTPESTHIFFGGLDLSGLKLYKRQDDELLMMNDDRSIVLDKYSHKRMLDFLCSVHNIKKKVERAGNKYTKQILIEEDRKRIALNKGKPFQSQLVPIISTMVNSADFKYSLETVRGMKYYAFMDSVLRLQMSNSINHLTAAYYSGNIDTSKFDVKKLDLFCDIHKAES